MKSFLLLFIISFLACSRQISVEQGSYTIEGPVQAIMIDQSLRDGPCEPSIAINPSNPNNVIVGAILDKVYISNNGGRTWKKDKLKSSYGVYGDPVVRADNLGNIYYAHLSNPNGRAYTDTAFLDRIVIQKSSDEGKSWTDGSYTLPRSPKDQDKQWLAIHPVNNNVYISWTEFDLYNSEAPEDKSRILFSKSIDNGDSWTYPVVISEKEGDCLDDDNTTEGAVPSVGPNGELYIAWGYNEKIYFDRSFDDGVTWLQHDILAAEQPGGWTFEVPGIFRTNGMPVTGVDRSNGVHRGRIYINWSDQRNGADNTDIWLKYSDDHGNTWSEDIRVNNDDTKTHQFMSWMAIDQSTGYVYVVFYDRRAHKDKKTDVYLAYSTDGGQTFQNIKISSSAFKPNDFVFFGDYNDIVVHDGMVRPVWTQLDGNLLSIWTALIN